MTAANPFRVGDRVCWWDTATYLARGTVESTDDRLFAVRMDDPAQLVHVNPAQLRHETVEETQ